MTQLGLLGLAALGLVLACAAPLLDAQQTAAPAEELRAEVVNRLDVRQGQPGRLRVNMVSGDLLRFDFDPGDYRFVLSIRSPEGNDLLSAEFLSGSYGPLPVLVRALTTGDYEIKVEAVEDAAGPCIITFRERRPYEPNDDSPIFAQNAIFEGERLTRQASADSLRSAVNQFSAARVTSKVINDNPGEAVALTLLGRAQMLQVQFKIAGDSFESARELWNRVGNHRGEAQAMSLLAEVQRNLGETEKALETLQRALIIRREVADRRGEGDTLNTIGGVEIVRSDFPRALEALNAAFEIRQSLGDRTGLISTLNNIAVVHNLIGEPRSAIESYEQALSLLASIPNQRAEAALLVNLGRAYASLPQYQKAIDYDQRALAVDKELKDLRAQGLVLNNLGTVYQALNDPERALSYYEQSLAIKRALPDRDRGAEAATLANIGVVRIGQHQYRLALEPLNAAAGLLSGTGERVTEGNILNNIGDAYAGLREYEAAIDYLKLGLDVRTDIGDRWGQAYSRTSLGAVYLSLERYPDAIRQYERARALSQEAGDRNAESGARYGLARTKAAVGDLDGAYLEIESALGIIESSRTQVILQNLRTSYLASHHDCYEFAIDVLMRLHAARPSEGFAERALEVYERAHARSLVEMIRESGADIRRGVSPELLERERTLRERLATKVDRRLRGTIGRPGTSTAAIDREIDTISRELEDTQAEIKAKSPAYAALLQPEPPTSLEIRQAVGDVSTVLLEYSLGAERSYGWLVSRDSIQAFSLPPRATLEEVGRWSRDLITTRGGSLQASAAREKEAKRLAVRLGAMLLGPVARTIQGKRLVIVPDGVLSYLPFDALGEPGAQTDSYVPLVAKHAISLLPSASALLAVRSQNRNRPPAPKMLAIIADPVFDRLDTRVHNPPVPSRGDCLHSAGTPVDAARRGTRNLPGGSSPQGQSLARLGFARRECMEIQSAIPGASVFLDFDASVDTVTSSNMALYRIVHVATHGFLDSERPDQSALVFSLVDHRGNPRVGFLPVGDVFNLNLPAEIVVLSACETALGRDIRGEGLVGLTRAFMYAGATRVVASLWKVDELATSELMKTFYEKLAAGKNPVEALQLAKLALKDKGWSPYYWAGFELQGEFEGSPSLRLQRGHF